MGKSSKKKSVTKKQSDGIPLECSPQEYQELQQQVAQLSVEEAKEEVLECARYGEVDAVRALLAKFPDIVNVADDSGNTALHKAAANGHTSTTRVLVRGGASLKTNESGNTPLHWAAASGHDGVVNVLLNGSSFDVNVLQKNEFGRSILTEGFSSSCTAVVKLLLEHDSASEEKLLTGGEEVDGDDEENENGASDNKLSSVEPRKKKKASVTHEFRLCDDTGNGGKPLCIRELQIAHADNPFGDDNVEDTTGFGIWCASLVMARWMASKEMQQRFNEKTILELGAGCGVPGLAAAHYSNASRVYVTDLNPTTVENLQYNVDLNFPNDNDDDKRVVCTTIDWNDSSTWPTDKLDYVIGSDLIYQESIVPLLKKAVLGMLKQDTGRFLYVAPDTGRDGLEAFIETMKHDSCTLVSVKEAPEAYYTNPLSSGDEEDCFLHFNELASSKYMLYEFACSQIDEKQ